jgi:AcrR family transcriptional regulator
MNVEDDDAANRALEQRARADLRRNIEQTAADVRAQLDRIVENALNQPRRPRLIRFTAPAVTVAVFAGILVAQFWRASGAPPAPPSEDMALLLNADLDLLEQMEFYRWLDQQPGILDEAVAAGSAQRS